MTILCFGVVSIGSVAFEKLCTALTNNSLVKGIKQAPPFAQTSFLEGFHLLLNQFAPKMIGYSYVGMYCRYSVNKSISGGCNAGVLVLSKKVPLQDKEQHNVFILDCIEMNTIL